MNSFKYIVYCTTNQVNNKIYIGVHKTYSEKFDNYLGNGIYANKPNTYEHCKTVFQRAVKKYGPKNFIRKTLAEFDNADDAYFLEEILVNEDFLARDDVYNMILGGYGNRNMKEYCSCSCYSLDGKFIHEYNSIREAGRAMTTNGCVFNAIKGAIIDKVKYKNMYWSFDRVELLDISNYSPDRIQRIKVYQYSDTGNFECEYSSLTDAGEKNNMHPSSINKACLLGYLSKNKYFSFEKNKQFSNAKCEFLKKIPIYVYDYNGNFIAEYQNEENARKGLGIRGSLMKYLRLKQVYNNKYQFSFQKIDRMPNRSIGEKRTTAKKIDQYDLNGNFIKTWESIAECCRELGVSNNSISRILKGTQAKTKDGWTFKEHQIN